MEPRAPAVGCPSLVGASPSPGGFARSLSQSVSFLLFQGVPARVHRVRIVDRCRRFPSCRTIASYTSSSPDRCALAGARSHRPFCHACLTAATGDSAPSHPRVSARLTSCSSYESCQEGREICVRFFLSEACFARNGAKRSGAARASGGMPQPGGRVVPVRRVRPFTLSKRFPSPLPRCSCPSSARESCRSVSPLSIVSDHSVLHQLLSGQVRPGLRQVAPPISSCWPDGGDRGLRPF